MRLNWMGWVVATALGMGVVGCQGNTIDLEDDAGGDGTATPGDAGTGGGDDGADVSDGADPDADGDTGPIVTTLDPDPDPDTGDREPSGLAEGRYLLVVSTVIDPTRPLQWEVNVTRDPDSFAGQSLSLEMGSMTDPRELVGGIWDAKLVATPDEIEIVVPPLQIIGEANPITGSEIITTEMVLVGRPSPTNGVCGEADGQVVEPLMLPLLGSTFALVPLGAGEAYPVDFPVGC